MSGELFVQAAAVFIAGFGAAGYATRWT